MGKNNKTGPSDSEDAGSQTNSPGPVRKQSWEAGPNRAESTESLEEFGEPLKFDPDFSGPIKKRVCTGT